MSQAAVIHREFVGLALLMMVTGAALSRRYSPMDASATCAILLLLGVSILWRLGGGKDSWASWLMLLGAMSFMMAWAPAALILALSNSVPFIGGKWSTSCDAITALRTKCPFSAWPVVLAGLQSGFSLLLLFLIGLGLRNRFRIGSG